MTTTQAPITAELLTEWANAGRERTIHELTYLIEGLQSDLRNLERGNFVASEHALRYRQYCEELHKMQMVTLMIDYAPRENAQ